MQGRRTSTSRVALLAAAAIAALKPAAPHAALQAVSGATRPAVDAVVAGGPKAAVAYSLATGFPLWYQDANGLRLELCLDREATTTLGEPFAPCLTAEPFLSAPISFPTNFGAEAFWWVATAFTTYTSILDGQPVAGDALLVLAQEAVFADDLVADGNQAAFGRIRVRVNVPVPGRYLVTHPYGEREYQVAAVQVGREINQTQDVGNALAPAPAGPPPAGDFTLALADGPTPPPVPGLDPSIDVGAVSSAATGIGPFLVAAEPLGVVETLGGARYLSNPGTELAPLTVRVAGSPRSTNFFRVKLLDPRPGFFLNAADLSQEVVVEQFQLAGKLFDSSPNAAPLAAPDLAATRKGAPVEIDVLANDGDAVGPGNAHGLDPRAIGLLPVGPGEPPGTILLTRPLTTALGGTVRRTTSLVTGKATFLYTPPPGFTGVDTFAYVAQDTGGLLSAPALVSVTVEELAISSARHRARSGRWEVAGTSTDRSANVVTVQGAPRARLDGASLPAPVQTAARATVVLRPGEDAIEYRLVLDRSPQSAVTSVHLHVGGPGQTGDAILVLHDGLSEGPLAGEKRGALGEAQLFSDPASGVFTLADAAEAIRAGRTYVDVHTTDHPAGELRGAVAAPVLGSAAVDPATGNWRFEGKSRSAPAGSPDGVSAVSANGVRAARVLQAR